MPNYVGGRGNSEAKMLILGEAPGQTEDAQGEPFIGKSGEVLDSIFKSLNILDWRAQFYVTNVYKYRPPNNNIKLISQVCNVEQSTQQLWNEINTIKPNIILALGKTALQAVTDKDKLLDYRGSVIQSIQGNPKVLGTLHPANLIRQADNSPDSFGHKPYPNIWRNIVTMDIMKALEESKEPYFTPPQRELIIARCSDDITKFIRDKRENRSNVFLDVETMGSSLITCMSLAFDRHSAISFPLLSSISGFNVTSIPTSDLARIWEILDELYHEVTVSGHNLKFDQQKKELLGFKFYKGLSSDTMLKAHTLNPELPKFSLSFLSSIYTKEPYWKEEGREFQYGKHPIERLFLYNAKDSTICAEIDEELEKEFDEFSEEYGTDLREFYHRCVKPQHQFYFDLEKTGFCVNPQTKQFLTDKYEMWLFSLKERLNAAAGFDININSPKQVAEFIYGYLSMPVQKRRNTKGLYSVTSDEDAVANMLKAGVKDDYRRDILTQILEYRRVSKTLSTYIRSKTDYDGKLRGEYRIIGTETGRSSTSVIDQPTRPYKQGFAFQTLTKHGDIGQDVRLMLEPEPGWVFVNTDLSQAEARVVALLSNDYELLEAFDKIDIHRRTAALCLFTGILNLKPGPDSISDKIGKDSPERFIGKKVRHAGNYNMKWKTFLQNVISDCRRFGIDMTMSPFKAKQILEKFHKASPKIVEVFHQEVIECLNRDHLLINPFGRARRFFERSGPELNKEGFANIPQGTVKDNLMRAGLSIHSSKKYPIKFNGEAHDAFLMQMPRGEYIDICREIRSTFMEPIDFSRCSLPRGKLIIPVDFEVGDNYKELIKVKL